MLKTPIQKLARTPHLYVVAQALAAVMLILFFVHATFAQKVSTEFDPTVDFTRFKTFAIREGQLNSKNPALNSELTKKRLETEIEHALTAKGMVLVTGKSDLNVRFQFGAARKMEAESYPAGWRGLGTRVVRVPYNEGTLVIDLRDPTTRSLVWRGIATESQRNATKIADKLDDMVKKAFAKFPPKK